MNYKPNGEIIEVYFHKDLRDIFKNTFRTAKWNGADRSKMFWYVKNTTANTNKLNKFVASLEVQERVKYLAEVDHAEWPEAEELALHEAHVFYSTVHSPEQALDWLYNTAILEIPLDQNTPYVLERQALSANVEEAKPARARFKI